MLPILALRPTVADVEEASIWLGGDADVFGVAEPLKQIPFGCPTDRFFAIRCLR